MGVACVEATCGRRVLLERVLTSDVERLIASQTDTVGKIVEPLMEAVADTNERAARLEGGHDEMTFKVQ